MFIKTTTATAAIALMVGVGAYPVTATAQSDTEQVDVEVKEVEGSTEAAVENVEESAEEAGEAVEQTAEEAGEAVEETAEQAGEAAEETAEEAGDAVEETAEEAGQAAEETAEATEQTAEEAAQQAAEEAQKAAEEVREAAADSDDLDETQKQELEQAAAEGKPVPRPEMIIGVQKEGQWLSGELIDREITNQNGEGIGEISGLLFSEDGPKGVIVDVGGFLGLGMGVTGMAGESVEEAMALGLIGANASVSLIGTWLYFAIMESSKIQATVGRCSSSARIALP